MINFTHGIPTSQKQNKVKWNRRIIDLKWNDVRMLCLNQRSNRQTIVQQKQNMNFLLIPTTTGIRLASSALWWPRSLHCNLRLGILVCPVYSVHCISLAQSIGSYLSRRYVHQKHVKAYTHVSMHSKVECASSKTRIGKIYQVLVLLWLSRRWISCSAAMLSWWSTSVLSCPIHCWTFDIAAQWGSMNMELSWAWETLELVEQDCVVHPT